MTTSFLQNVPFFVIENKDHQNVLRSISHPVTFPLSQEDKELIKTLKHKVNITEFCGGLAAPQIGISKRIIAFQVMEKVLKFRRDVEFLMPMTILINPSYMPHAEEGKSLDWEGCFSVQSQMGKVWHFKTITYFGQTEEGESIEGIARGYLARLLQHEIDHLDGKLAIDFYDPLSPRGPLEEMRKIRLKEIEDLQS
ncbi:MAG: peptide deformylase [Proteobacteria bacterium]|nr:peptide deformylase [Pseudomonadota bacterium]